MPQNVKDKILYFLDVILKGFDPGYTLEILQEADQYRIVINSDKNELLIGDNGEIVAALQHVLRCIVHKQVIEDKTHFLLDIGGFRKKREDNLKIFIPKLVKQNVIIEGKSIVFVGLSSYERLLIHKILADLTNLQTMSVGLSNNRKLLVMPTSDIGTQGLENAMIIDLKNIDIS